MHKLNTHTPPAATFHLWHKLLFGVGAAMILLALGLTLAATTSIRRAATEIGFTSKEILASQTERFLSTIASGQTDTIDLRLEQTRLAAIHAAAVVQSRIEAKMPLAATFLADLLADAGPFATTIYYVSRENKLTYYPPKPDTDTEIQSTHLSDTLPSVSFGTDTPTAMEVRWSRVHANPLAPAYDRIIDAIVPVVSDGRLDGYLGISISVIGLVSQFNDRQTIRGSYTFLMDNNHRLLSGPPHGTIELAQHVTPKRQRGMINLRRNAAPALGSVLDDMVLGNTAVQRTALNGRDKYIAYRPLTRQDWHLGLVVPVAMATAGAAQIVRVVDASGKRALWGMALTTLLLFGCSLVVVGFIARRLTRPLLEMAVAADCIARGDLERTITVTGSNEIAELGEAFNAMTDRLKHYIGSIEHQREELFDSEARYRTMFENSPIALWEEDFSEVKVYLDGLRQRGVQNLDRHLQQHPEKIRHCADLIRIVDVNEATMKLYGATTKTELIGSLPKVLDDTAIDVIRQEVVALAEGKRLEVACSNHTLDGRRLDIELRCLIPPGHEHSWDKVFVAVSDISDQVSAEREKKELEDQLRQAYKMEAIGTLAGGIAHDFNNILSAILGYTELLASEPSLNDNQRRYSQQVMKATLRAKDLVDQILAFSRQTEKVAKPVPVKRVVTEAVKLLRASLPSTIDIRQHLNSEGVVMADATQIHQVVMNLCTNAGHAMQENGGALTVRLSEVNGAEASHDPAVDLHDSPYVLLQVADTGEGMTAETMHRMFDPYFTTKGRHQGTGMGLAVVHGIIKSYGGQIYVNSELSSGSTFSVYLPLVDVAEPNQPSVAKPELPQGNESILLVDDEEILVDLGRLMLVQLGYRVTALTNSQMALDVITNTPLAHDLVISDMTMPHMTGDKLARAIHDIHPDLPIILCTGFSERLDQMKAMDHIAGILMKPLDMTALATTVRNALDAHAHHADRTA